MSYLETSKNVLFLNTAAGIWAHTSTDALLLNRLARRGVMVSTFACDGYLSGLCPVRRSRGRTLADVARKQNIDCSDCKFSSNLVTKASKSSHENKHWIGEYISSEARQEALDFILSWESSGCPLESKFHEVPIARLAGYEVSLTYKSWEEATLGPGKPEYIQAAHDAALTVLAAKAFLTSQAHFDDVIVRSPHYANNGAFSTVAKEMGIRVIFIDGSNNLSEDCTHVMMWDWNRYKSGNPAKALFPALRIDEDTIERERILRHLRALERGSSHKVYSAKRSLSSPLSVMGGVLGKPTALLALSSEDEAVTSSTAGVNPNITYPGTVFEDQYEWVRQTIAFFEAHQHLQLIIRVHPREFPSRREGRTSNAGIRWERELSMLPANVFLDHPNRKLSLYDLLEEVDVLVTGWSSVGLEAALKGVALVTYDSALPGYPAAIGLTGTSKDEYFRNLEIALSGSTGIPFRENALKWAHVLMNLGTTRLGGRLLASRRNLIPRWVNLVLEGCERYLYFVFRPLDLWRGILLEPTDWKFSKIILEGRSNLHE